MPGAFGAPSGQRPDPHHDAGRRVRSLAYRNQCPVQETPEGYHLEHTAKQRRVAERRREQDTEVFRQRYRRRSGIESTNSALKRRTGLGRLRVGAGPGCSRPSTSRLPAGTSCGPRSARNA